MAPEVRHDHPVAAGREQRGDLLVTVDVVWEAVHQDDRVPAGRPEFDVPDVEDAGGNPPLGSEAL